MLFMVEPKPPTGGCRSRTIEKVFDSAALASVFYININDRSTRLKATKIKELFFLNADSQ